MQRALLAGAVRVALEGDRPVADLLRVDGRVVVPASVPGPAVATLWPGSRSAGPTVTDEAGGGRRRGRRGRRARPVGLDLGIGAPVGVAAGVEPAGLVEPDPATMDLADARRVVAGGAGLVPAGAGDDRARAIFSLLAEVAAALGAAAGATRVVTDAGWLGYERQIGTTGVALDPELYVALGISGASQHVGGIGDPARVVSVNIDPSCPMTGRADLGLVTDAPQLLVELAGRLAVPVPPEVKEVLPG